MKTKIARAAHQTDPPMTANLPHGAVSENNHRWTINDVLADAGALGITLGRG